MANKPLVVVVVDDEECILRLVRRALGRCGCEIHEANDGRKGIDMIQDVRPDIIILDVRIPVIHGYEVCRYIRQDPDTRRAKVLMISGLMGESDREWANNCGADDAIQKPFDADELTRKVLDLAAKGS